MTDLDQVLRSKGATMKALLDAASGRGNLNADDDQQLGDDQPDPVVMQQLVQQLDKSGEPTGQAKSTRGNLHKIMSGDRRLKGKLWENLFTGTLQFDDRDYTDTDDTKIALWVDKAYNIRYSDAVVAGIAKLVGEDNGRNPLQEWLGSLKWDGVKRTGSWIVEATGCKDTKLHRMMGHKWLIQAIARAMQPGVKADCVLILIGKQGARKSSLLAKLATRDYFSDTPLDIGSANAYTQIQRAWIYEVAELDSVRRSANSATKAFISAQEDTYRPAYGRRAVTIKRHTVFAGTTNDMQFMNDSTGSRRYWPVQVGEIDMKWVAQNRDQLWAEAIVEYNSGVNWWLEQEWEEVREVESGHYQQEDPWHEVVRSWLTTSFGEFTIRHVMEDALKLDKHQMSRIAEMRTADVLRALGCSRKRKRQGSHRVYAWTKGNIVTLHKTGDNDE